MKMELSTNEYIALMETFSLLGVDTSEIEVETSLDLIVTTVGEDEESFLHRLKYVNTTLGYLKPILVELLEFMENDDNATQVMMDYIQRSIGVDFEVVMDSLAELKRRYKNNTPNNRSIFDQMGMDFDK